MKDIRIISGKQIRPDLNETTALLGCKTNDSLCQTNVSSLFENLLLPIQMRLRPKAALLIAKPSSGLTETDFDSGAFLYVMLTIGDGVSRLIETYTAEQEPLKASVANAMADSCLFAFERQLLPIIRQICLEENFGISGRLEIPGDLSPNLQKEIFYALDAGRTLGLSLTSGSMLKPEKSMSLVFALTDDLTADHLKHDCGMCTDHNCPLKSSSAPLLQVKWRREPGCDFETTEILCPPSGSLLDILQKNHIFPPAYCGGKGICGKCSVRVLEGNLPVTEGDRRIFSESELKQGMRLSCLATVKEPLSILVEAHPESDFKALGTGTDSPLHFKVSHTYSEKAYGAAIDIGTTTLAFSLLNLQNGICFDTLTMVNSQRAFGADVISRIQASNNGKKDLLQKSIRRDIQKGISLLLQKNPDAFGHLRHVSIAANTVMLHLLMGYSCEGFARYPFRAKTLALEEYTWDEIFGSSEAFSLSPKVTLLPGISPFVGADITAGLYACRILSESQPVLFLDLGTNGEMALWKNQKLFVASTAAGPAFEGGNIKWGMGSVPGAISSVKTKDGRIVVQTIGDRPPEGICGTGVIETAAELLHLGILDKTGKLDDSCFDAGYPLAQTKDSVWIRFTQQDVREIQMAKAAIRAGMEILLCHTDTSYEEIGKVYLAGGFGYYLNIEKAGSIGLLPKELLAKTIPVGNTSLKGGLMYLAEEGKDDFAQIRQAAEEISLAGSEVFSEIYFKYMEF